MLFNRNPAFNTLAMAGGGLDLGNPLANMLVMSMLGPSLANRPAPNSNQSIYDAMMLQRRTQEFMRVQQQANVQSLFAQRMQLDPNSQVLGFASMMFGGPDGAYNRFMSPLVGGNPVKAQMGMFANLTGHTTNLFSDLQGRNISVPQTTELMNTLYKQMYIQQELTPQMRADAMSNTRNSLLSKGLSPKAADFYISNPDQYFRQHGPLEADKLTDLLKKVAVEHEKIDGLKGEKLASQTEKFELARNDGMRIGQAIIDGVSDTASRDKLRGAFTEAMVKGTGEAWKKWEQTYAGDVKGIREVLSKYQTLTNSGPHPTGIDFNMTRGFQIEDITGGFTRASDLRLMGRGATTKEAFERFLNHGDAGGIGAMDAARSLFGNNLGGADLINKMQDLFGRTYFDLTNSSPNARHGAVAAENLMRDIKATARQTGISSDDILGLVSQTRQMTAMNPQLSSSGINIPQIVMRAINQATALDARMGPEYTVTNGGIVNMTQRAIQGQLESLQIPENRNLAALKYYMTSNNNVGGMAVIDAYLNNPNSDHSFKGFNRFQQRLAAAAKLSFGEIARIGEDDNLINLGMLAHPEVTEYGTKAVWHDIRVRMNMQRGNLAGPDRLKNFLRHINNGVSLEEAAAKQDVLFVGADESAAVLRLKNMGGEAYLRSVNDPAFKAIYDNQIEAQRIIRESEKEMSSKFGVLNAPVVQGIFNQFLTGKVGKEGISAILNTLRTSKDFAALRDTVGYKNLDARIEAFSALGGDNSNAAISAYFTKIGQGGANTTAEAFGNLFDVAKQYTHGAAILEAAKDPNASAKVKSAAATLQLLSKNSNDFRGALPGNRDDWIKLLGKGLVADMTTLGTQANDLRLSKVGSAQFNDLISKFEQIAKTSDDPAKAAENAKYAEELKAFRKNFSNADGTFDMTTIARLSVGDTSSFGDSFEGGAAADAVQGGLKKGLSPATSKAVENMLLYINSSRQTFTEAQDKAKVAQDQVAMLENMAKVLDGLAGSLKGFGESILTGADKISTAVTNGADTTR